MTISASFNDSPTAPGYDLTISGLTDYSFFKVVRRDLSGFLSDQDVRISGANPDGLVPTDGDTASGSDYEFTFTTNIQYRLEKYDENKNLDETDTDDVGFPSAPTDAYYGHAWLKDIFNISNSRPIIVGEFNTFSRSGRTAAFNVLGRANPVVVTDVLSGKTGQFTFYVMNVNQPGTKYPYSDYEELLAPGTTLYFQSLAPHEAGWRDFYFVVESYDFTRLTLAYNNVETAFQYTVSFTEVDRPATTSVDVSVNTWQMVLDNHDDWQDVLDSHSTWLDVYQDPQDLS